MYIAPPIVVKGTVSGGLISEWAIGRLRWVSRPIVWVAAALVVASFLVAAGCDSVKQGSGVESTETRDVGDFNRISVSGQTDVEVTIGATQTVTVRGDDNLISNVELETDDGELDISEEDGLDLRPAVGLTVEIVVPQLEGVSISGSADTQINGLSGGVFRAEVSGSGSVEAVGDINRAEAEVSGSGVVRFERLIAREVEANVSGSGSIDVFASESLDASVSGSGEIVYSGDPPTLDTEVSGDGDISARAG